MTVRWPEHLLMRDFRPREVELITGITPPRQRLMVSRHFDFRNADFYEGDSGPEGRETRWWNWEGVQLLTAFTEILGDLKSADLAADAMRRMAGVKEGAGRLTNFDYRGPRENGDLLLVKAFGTPLGFSSTGAKGLEQLYLSPAPGWQPPSGLYAYNLSAMQRRLSEGVRALGVTIE